MRRIKKLLGIMTAFSLLMSANAFASVQDGAVPFQVTESEIKSNERTLISTTQMVIDKDGNLKESAPYARGFADVAVVTHSFYDRGYNSSTDSHYYEVSMTAKLLTSDGSFSKSVFSIKPKGNKKYMDSTLHHNQNRVIADSIYYGYPGVGPDKPNVYAKEKLYLYGDSVPLNSPIDYMSRPLQ